MINVGNIYAGLGGGGGGGMVNTLDNGLTLTGTNGQLGGPLIQTTLVNAAGQQFVLASNDGSQVNEAFIIFAGGNQITFGATNGGSQFIGLFLDTTGQLLFVDQINGKGPTKDASILRANQLADPNAYITTDCLTAVGVPVVFQSDFLGETTTQTFNTITPGVAAMYRINVYATFISGTGSVDVSVGYQDNHGNTRVIALGSVTTGNEDLDTAAFVFKSGNFLPIAVVCVVTGGTAIYDCGIVLEQLF